MKHLVKTFWICLFVLPAVLFCSYYPVISLGSNSSMNFELSLPLIWLVVFDLVAFVVMIMREYQARKNPKASKNLQFKRTQWGLNFPGISDRKIFLLSLFPLFATISIFWSMNPIRAILTAGIIWLVFFAVFAIIFVSPLLEQPKNFRAKVMKAILIPSLVICGVCWLQCFLDIWGVGREQSLLCRGCVSDLFGFPHPSGFAIEPQFMGNLLLAPTLLALYLVVFPQKKSVSKTVAWVSAAICSATLFITFSRGAIYAYFVALAIMFIFAVAQHKSHRQLAATNTQRGPRLMPIIAVPATTFLFALIMQGTFAVLGPTSTTFIGGITKSIHHLSLGVIDLRPDPKTSQSTPEGGSELQEDHYSSDPPSDQAQAESSLQLPENTQNQPVFNGYVAESTNIRLNLNEIALKTWLSAPIGPIFNLGADCGQPYNELCFSLTPVSIFFGVGLGGAGAAMHSAFPDQIPSSKEIVQNQTFSLLLELGTVGVFLAHLALVVAFLAPLLPWWFVDGKAGKKRPQNQYKGQGIIRRTLSKLQENEFWSSPALPLLLALIVAYIVTLNFFSGLPNALQIYLMPPLILIIYRQNSAKNS